MYYRIPKRLEIACPCPSYISKLSSRSCLVQDLLLWMRKWKDMYEPDINLEDVNLSNYLIYWYITRSAVWTLPLFMCSWIYFHIAATASPTNVSRKDFKHFKIWFQYVELWFCSGDSHLGLPFLTNVTGLHSQLFGRWAKRSKMDSI